MAKPMPKGIEVKHLDDPNCTSDVHKNNKQAVSDWEKKGNEVERCCETQTFEMVLCTDHASETLPKQLMSKKLKNKEDIAYCRPILRRFIVLKKSLENHWTIHNKTVVVGYESVTDCASKKKRLM